METDSGECANASRVLVVALLVVYSIASARLCVERRRELQRDEGGRVQFARGPVRAVARAEATDAALPRSEGARARENRGAALAVRDAQRDFLVELRRVGHLLLSAPPVRLVGRVRCGARALHHTHTAIYAHMQVHRAHTHTQ